MTIWLTQWGSKSLGDQGLSLIHIFLKGNIQEIEYYAHHPHKDPEPAQIYLDRIKQLQAERRRLKKLIARDQKRVEFIQEHCDMFHRAEHHYLYGDDL